MKRMFFVVASAVLALTACTDKTRNAQVPAVANETVTITQATPPPGGSWSDVVNATSNGYMMGNPNAKVKLVEIASLGCPYCRAFEVEGAPQLISKYVKTGMVSWEFRPYIIHGPIDMAANLIARCNGAKSFFPLAQALYKDQPVWMAKIEAVPQDKLAQVQALPTNQLFVELANLAGLQRWAAMRGLPEAKSNQCLSDQKMIDREVQDVTDVSNQYPDFTGTPAFVVDGKLLPSDTTTFDKLEPALTDALK
jgi:protein-disulfide isomerase